MNRFSSVGIAVLPAVTVLCVVRVVPPGYRRLRFSRMQAPLLPLPPSLLHSSCQRPRINSCGVRGRVWKGHVGKGAGGVSLRYRVTELRSELSTIFPHSTLHFLSIPHRCLHALHCTTSSLVFLPLACPSILAPPSGRPSPSCRDLWVSHHQLSVTLSPRCPGA